MPELPQRLLVVRLSALGDCLHTLPLVDRLRAAMPEARLGWAIGGPAAPLLEGHPQIDRFHVLPRRARAGGSRREWWSSLRKLRREMVAERWEVALDVHGLTKSGLVALYSGAPRRIGFEGPESRELNRFFLTERAPTPEGPHHVVERNLSVLGALGLDPAPDGAASPGRLPDYAEERARIARWWDRSPLEGRPFAVLQPGTTWTTKIWPEGSFGRLARELPTALDLDVVVLWGGADEEEKARRIVVAADSPRVHPAPPTDLRDLAALIGSASLAVGNDSGPLHLAAALGVPCVGIHGATDPVRNGPWGDAQRTVVAPVELECRPCWKRTCQRGDLACLTLLPASRVLDACEEALAARGARRS